MLVEIGLVSVHPYPFLVGRTYEVYNTALKDSVYYYVNDFLNLLAFFRLFYIITALLLVTEWMSDSARRVW